MKNLLTMKADGTGEHRPDSDVTGYIVLGMPSGGARIHKSGESWRITPTDNSSRLYPGEYASPKEALAALQAELDQIAEDDANSW